MMTVFLIHVAFIIADFGQSTNPKKMFTAKEGVNVQVWIQHIFLARADYI